MTQRSIIIRSHFLRKILYSIAALVFIFHIFAAVFLCIADTGASLRLLDQYAIAGIGCIISAAVLWCSRCYVYADNDGLLICNCSIQHYYRWVDVSGFVFEKYYAYLILDNDERVMILAINICDKEHAVTNLTNLRKLFECSHNKNMIGQH